MHHYFEDWKLYDSFYNDPLKLVRFSHTILLNISSSDPNVPNAIKLFKKKEKIVQRILKVRYKEKISISIVANKVLQCVSHALELLQLNFKVQIFAREISPICWHDVESSSKRTNSLHTVKVETSCSMTPSRPSPLFFYFFFFFYEITSTIFHLFAVYKWQYTKNVVNTSVSIPENVVNTSINILRSFFPVVQRDVVSPCFLRRSNKRASERALSISRWVSRCSEIVFLGTFWPRENFEISGTLAPEMNVLA